MSSTKTPTSSLSVIELLAMRVWYRGKARIARLLSTHGSSETPTAQSSGAANLPLNIVESIIAHLIYDKHSLLACSLTCHTWYIACVPHLHRTLFVWSSFSYYGPEKSWPAPLENLSKLGLLPFVKDLIIKKFYGHPQAFSPKHINSRALRQFARLTNIQDLKIDDLDIPKFMPRVRHYFGHFMPMLRSLGLNVPRGSRRQIFFFIGLFEHLEDFMLHGGTLEYWQNEPVKDLTLVPLFVPPLRGRLVMSCFSGVGFLKDMVDLFGGVRFHYMDLFAVGEARLLLNAAAETLETARLYPADPYASLPDFDFTRNKSLRTLEVMAWSVIPKSGSRIPSNDATWSFLETALSTIASPTSFEVVVVYIDHDFGGALHRRKPQFYGDLTPAERASEASRHRELLKLFRRMHTVRNFQLVLCVDVWDGAREYAMELLKQAIAVEKAGKDFGYSPPEPLMIYHPRGRWRP